MSRRSSLASSAVGTRNHVPVIDVKSEPILRTLYTPPPRLDEFNASCSDGVHYVTEVTNGTLATEEGSPHVLYYEVHHRIPVVNGKIQSQDGAGSKRGLTGLVLHGGPGAGCFPRHANFFSPELYEYVVLLDQRGCGKSTPLGEISHNTLSLLVHDVEQLRSHLLDDRSWDCILGGSWGCTLALAYAHSFPSKIRAMVLRGVCLFRPQEIDWLFGDPPSIDASTRPTSNLRHLVNGGKSARESESTNALLTRRASQLFSEGWKEFCKGVGLADTSHEQGNRNALHQYYHRLLGSDPIFRARAAQSWFRYEMGVYSRGYPEQINSNDTNTKLLVWNPITESWHYESAEVCSNQSFVSGFAAESYQPVDGGVAQSLRRCSESPHVQLIPERIKVLSEILKPLPIEEVKDVDDIATKKNQSNASNNTFDPAKFIPAQAMLTCFYSANDEYVVQDYREFLSLGSNMSWYRSRLPPSSHKNQLQAQSNPEEYPLPPCIAIQGAQDAICPPDTALDLHHVWKELELRVALGSGHSMYDPVIAGEIVKALDRFGHTLTNEELHEY